MCHGWQGNDVSLSWHVDDTKMGGMVLTWHIDDVAMCDMVLSRQNIHMELSIWPWHGARCWCAYESWHMTNGKTKGFKQLGNAPLHTWEHDGTHIEHWCDLTWEHDITPIANVIGFTKGDFVLVKDVIRVV